jgi:hypothetical protein
MNVIIVSYWQNAFDLHSNRSTKLGVHGTMRHPRNNFERIEMTDPIITKNGRVDVT